MNFLKRYKASVLVAGVALLALVSVSSAQQIISQGIAWAGNGHVLFSATAPTISSGFGTSPSIVASNGAAAFEVNVGTGGSATTGVIAMPTATTGWNCSVTDLTAAAAGTADAITAQTTGGTTTVTVKQRTVSTGVALAWAASDKLKLICAAY